MDIINNLLAIGIGTGNQEILKVFFVLLGIFAACVFVFLVYYFLAFVLIWPRLLAKYLVKKKSNVSKIRKLKVLFLFGQFFVFILIIIITALTQPELSKILTLIALLYGILFFVVWGFIRIAYHIPLLNLFIFQDKPPDFFLREIGTFWTNILWHPSMSILLMLLIASHIAGIMSIVFGIILSIKFRKLIPKNEDKDKLDMYKNFYEMKKHGSKKYILGELALRDMKKI